MCFTYHEVVFCFFLVAHSHDSQHQVDEVERPEENDYGEKYNTHGTAGGHNLCEETKQTYQGKKVYNTHSRLLLPSFAEHPCAAVLL